MPDEVVHPDLDLGSSDLDLSGEFDHALGCGSVDPNLSWVQPEFLDGIREILATIRYKPESSFVLRDEGDLMLTTVEYDRATGERMSMPYNDEAFAARVQAFMADRGLSLARSVLASFRVAVHAEERHESDEWIAFEDEYPFDPHDPTANGLHVMVHGADIGM